VGCQGGEGNFRIGRGVAAETCQRPSCTMLSQDYSL
jgi:hypothetical protein